MLSDRLSKQNDATVANLWPRERLYRQLCRDLSFVASIRRPASLAVPAVVGVAVQLGPFGVDEQSQSWSVLAARSLARYSARRFVFATDRFRRRRRRPSQSSPVSLLSFITSCCETGDDTKRQTTATSPLLSLWLFGRSTDRRRRRRVAGGRRRHQPELLWLYERNQTNKRRAVLLVTEHTRMCDSPSRDVIVLDWSISKKS